MKFIVNKDKLEIDNLLNVVSGSIGYYEAEVEFDKSWNTLVKKAVMVKEGETTGKDIAVIKNRILIDQKLEGTYAIGFVGYKIENADIIYQISTNLKLIHFAKGSGEIETKTEEVPTASEWELYIAQIQELLSGVDIGGGTGGGGIVEETDPTVPQHVKDITEEDIEKWNNDEIAETLYALGSDYAEYFEWEDGNPRNEDRTCLFVSIVSGTRKIKKAMRGEDILGITSIDASIIGNARYKDEKTYSAVGMTGVMRLRDNGNCKVGDYVVPADNGLAMPSDNDVGYKVTARYEDNLIEVLMAHDSEMISRTKDELVELDNEVQELYETISNKADKTEIPTDFYKKSEISMLLATKVNTSDLSTNYYNKTDMAVVLAPKVNLTDLINAYYNKNQIDSMVGNIETLLGGI